MKCLKRRLINKRILVHGKESLNTYTFTDGLKIFRPLVEAK